MYSAGNYSRLACEIQFVRSMGYYLIQIYIPSGLIVIISWVSFWLNRNATPARVQLGVTTVLTMTTLMSSTNAALPKISYVKSIDVYLGTCFVMVFTSLLGMTIRYILTITHCLLGLPHVAISFHRVRYGRLYVKEDTDEEAEVRGASENIGREERAARATALGLAFPVQNEHHERRSLPTREVLSEFISGTRRL